MARIPPENPLAKPLEDVVAAIATVFDGNTTLPLPRGHALVLPDIEKMTPYTREAIMTALIEARAVKG